MAQEIIMNNAMVGMSHDEIESVFKERREKLRAEREKKVGEFLHRIECLPGNKKVIEIKKEFGVDICLVSEELYLNLNQLGSILVYRIMCKEPCPAAEFGLCIFGYKNVLTREKCPFCQGYGTAEWDNY